MLARGRLTLYEARGDYQLVADSLEEAGEGVLRTLSADDPVFQQFARLTRDPYFNPR